MSPVSLDKFGIMMIVILGWFSTRLSLTVAGEYICYSCND